MVSINGKSCKSIGGSHADAEGESYPIGAVLNGDGVLGRIDRHAYQGNLTAFRDSNLIHQGNIQGVQRTSPSGTVVGGLATSLRLDNDGDGYYDTYDHVEMVNNQMVHEEKETIYGEVLDRSKIVYNNPLHDSSVDDTTTPETSFFGNSFNGISKETVYTYDEQASMANGLEFAKEESVTFQDIVDSGVNTNILIPCYANVATEIVVSIYLEGWDKQCVNATMGASFEGNLSFKLLKGGLPS